MRYRLSEVWIKASIIGTIWAASEIVLGSFLHNLKIPFSGNVLTAIGIIILISISHTWNERGLFWRAGLICAVMKTMSPSAVIFGPMTAILAESLLLELSVRLFGRTAAGYVAGAMLAMSWNLFQKIANYIIYYGSNIIEVYSNLLKFARKQLGIQTEIVWLPIIALLILYALFGLFAAVTGMIVGRKMLKQPAADVKMNRIESLQGPAGKIENKFDYSVTWLLINTALIPVSFILLNYTSWIIWSIAITGIIFVWSLRYKRALRQLSKPGFWIFFVVITLITAFAFTKAQPGENPLYTGLLTGVQMNFRAAVIIVGFSVLGTELYNPVIRNFFIRSSFRNLPLALELSAESLPLFIANIPDLKALIKNPVAIFYQVISHADIRLNEIRKKAASADRIFLITGPIGLGKTTYARQVIDVLRDNNINSEGFLSERIMTEDRTSGYDLVDISTGRKKVFLRQDEDCGDEKIGRFTICPEGLSMGNEILDSVIPDETGIVLIDEVGMLELQDRGWSGALTRLLGHPGINLLITVRDIYVKDVKDKWDLSDATIFDISGTDARKAGLTLLGYITTAHA